MKNLTFSTKGLTTLQVKFLQEIEKKYFMNEPLNMETVYKIGAPFRGNDPKKILEAWDYWNWMPKPVIKETLKKPIEFFELLDTKGSFYLSTHSSDKKFKGIDRVNSTEKLSKIIDELGLIYPINSSNYYFEIINNCLYIKYQQIIGSRFLAIIK